MMKVQTSASLACALFLTACGGGNSGLTIQITPQELPADGQSTARIEVRAIFQDLPAPDDTSVRIRASAGTFQDSRGNEITVQTMAGVGTAHLIAPNETQQVTLTAGYDDPYGISHQATATLMVVDPPPIDGTTFVFNCAAKTLGLPIGTEAVRLPCTVRANDITGKAVPLDLKYFTFMSETGYFQIEGEGDEARLWYVVEPNEFPKDVDPGGGDTDGEPRWVDGNRTRNPRDGVATLVVHARGVPGSAQDYILGEPFVDANDNGQYDPGVETFVDGDENGAWSPSPAGAEARRIWRWYKLVLTGPTSSEAPKRCAQLQLWQALDGQTSIDQMNVDRSGTVSFKVVLVDQNLNPVAVHADPSSPDYIELGVQPYEAQLNPERVNLERDYPGVLFDEVTGEILGRDNKSTYTRPLYSFTLRNNRRTDDTGPDVPWHTDRVEISRTIAPDAARSRETLPTEEAPSGLLR